MEEHNYLVEEVYGNCSTLFYNPIKKIKAGYNNLQIYGINLDVFKDTECFSALLIPNILDKLDVGIVCGTFQYLKHNFSGVKRVDVSPYKINLARSRGVTENEIFGERSNKIVIREIFSKNIFYGRNVEDYFKKLWCLYISK